MLIMEKKLGVDPLSFIKEDDGFIYANLNPEYEDKLDQYKLNIKLKKSGIPTFYWDIEFNDYEGDKKNKSYLKIKYYAENFDQLKFNHTHLFCYGLHSTQKTALAINVLKSALKKGFNVDFILAGTLLQWLMSLQSFNIEKGIREEINKLKRSDIILIDDCFDPDKSLMWKNSENKNMIVCCWDLFLREIISSNTKVIITSNFDIDTIEQYYGKSLYELIYRNFAQIEFTESVKQKRKSKVEDIFKNLM